MDCLGVTCFDCRRSKKVVAIKGGQLAWRVLFVGRDLHQSAWPHHDELARAKAATLSCAAARCGQCEEGLQTCAVSFAVSLDESNGSADLGGILDAWEH